MTCSAGQALVLLVAALLAEVRPMRIALLVLILMLLLIPSLGSSAAAPIVTPLRPTPTQPQAGGTVQLEWRNGQTSLVLEVYGLPPGYQAPPAGAAWRAEPVYVVWLADSERRLYNLGTLPVDQAGHGVSTFTPLITPSAGSVLAISAEPRADVPVPSAPRETMMVSALLADSVTPQATHLGPDLGPGWLAPIIPATLGLILLRHAARTRRAELQARRAT